MAQRLTDRRRIVVAEYGDDVAADISDEQAHRLVNASLAWKERLKLPDVPLALLDSPTGYRLGAKFVTGVIGVGDIDIEIAPKFLSPQLHNSPIWRAALWRILALIGSAPAGEALTAAAQTREPSLPDLMADIFLDSFWRGSLRGLPLRYVEHEYLGSAVHGTFDARRAADWLARPWLVPSRTDELIDDTAVARLFRWAAEQLAQTVIAPSRRRALRAVSSALAHVGHLPPDRHTASQLSVSPQHQVLEGALAIATLLLSGQGLDHAAGRESLPGFLWNSDEVYEDFVFWVCRRAGRRLRLSVVKESVVLGEPLDEGGRRLRTTPDVVFRGAEGPAVAVLDAKYKRFGQTPRAPDSYQILAAAHSLGCPAVALTYPADQYRPTQQWRVRSGLHGLPVTISALALDLLSAATDEGLGDLVSHVADWVQSAQDATSSAAAETVTSV